MSTRVAGVTQGRARREEPRRLGIFNRDYMRTSGRGMSFNPAQWSALQLVIVVNVSVFLLWNLGGLGGDLTHFLNVHFTTSLASLKAGYVWTLLTSVFSHETFLHILFNMFVLFMFGRTLEESFGKRRFLVFYCLAGIFANCVQCSLPFFGFDDRSTLGASGAVAGVVMVFALQDPHRKLYFFGVLAVPAWVLVAILVGFDLLGFVQQAVTGLSKSVEVARGAHLAGSGFGALYFFGIMRGSFPRLGQRKRRRRAHSAGVDARSYAAPPVQTPFDRTAAEELKLDTLLRKVGEGGLDSLTPKERDFLMEMSKKSRRP